ncbi:uncharacterized protein YbaP (TraB family) [Sphingobium sp. B11D3B]|uniref:TraB/GumN family protein n=1 Tax=Sphingobium sp. B11D3B TaxID=2940575 RepID=UPI002227F3E9|nr:TraB/GumN family protein [Sphingobium sp. B11D3B]MCW2388048.1 uncharacterized protein YbaP (TraB family) [Sphingobium sp. B11D3B]
MNWKTLILGWALLLPPALTGPALAQQPKAPATPAAAAEAPTVHARPALWVVRDRDTTIYLFGTIHLLKPGISWFEGPVRKAFDKADTVVLEVIDQDQGATREAIMQRAVAPGLPLSNKLDEATRTAYFAALEKYGVSTLLFDHVKPWFAATTLTVLPLDALGYSPESGVDKAVKAATVNAGKSLVGLETSSEQIGFFDQIPEGVQLTLLKETLAELPTLAETIDGMVAAWSAGDEERLAALMNETTESSEEIERILLTDRNARWAEWIAARMKQPGTVFMAVGAGHLSGDKSVQAMLEKHGLSAKRVKWPR